MAEGQIGCMPTLLASALATSLLSFLLYDTHQGSGRGDGFRTGPGQSRNHCGCIAYHQSSTRVHQKTELAKFMMQLSLCPGQVDAQLYSRSVAMALHPLNAGFYS